MYYLFQVWWKCDGNVNSVTMFPNVAWSAVVACYPIFTFSYSIIIPTKFLCASSAWHRQPTGPSHTRGRVEVSELLRYECRWNCDSYSAWGNAKCLLPPSIHKHTPILPFCHETVYTVQVAIYTTHFEKYSASCNVYHSFFFFRKLNK